MNKQNQSTENTTVHKMPTSFYILAILFLIWGLLGVFHFVDYLGTSVERLMTQGMTREQAEFFFSVPRYYVVLFGLGTTSGLLGSILLLLRKAWAAPVFLFSAFITITSFVFDYFLGSYSVLGTPYIAVVIVTATIAIFEVWYARRVKTRFN